ncbi:hypothetical protein [Kitasatospora sp. NPDC088783]|uniref:hypothetical protein n=1 Tax=Kitasatospora sp. NPDC088783 TaxID=3364077 RepID=UPI00381C9A3A
MAYTAERGRPAAGGKRIWVLWAVGAVSAALYAVFLHVSSGGPWWLSIAAGALWAVMTVGLIHWGQRRRARKLGLSGLAELAELGRAIKDERIPQDPVQQNVLRTVIRHNRKRRRLALWSWLIVGAVMIWNAVSMWHRHGPAAGIISSLFVLAWIPTMYFADRRQQQKLHHLELRLQELDSGRTPSAP